MMLLTKELRRKLPALRANEDKKPENIQVIVKFFLPNRLGWKWYATEFDQNDIFFGYVRGVVNELGYFRLSELEYITDGMGLGVERDRHFSQHTLAEVMAEAL